MGTGGSEGSADLICILSVGEVASQCVCVPDWKLSARIGAFIRKLRCVVEGQLLVVKVIYCSMFAVGGSWSAGLEVSRLLHAGVCH